tara:strand:- start:233 stop:427 length:195 start_codon:yes stop_codon:yes gene_type:complete
MSYMDRKNIIEGFLDLFKKLPDDVRKLKLTSAEKRLYKTSPKFKKIIDKMIKNKKELDKLMKKK